MKIGWRRSRASLAFIWRSGWLYPRDICTYSKLVFSYTLAKLNSVKGINGGMIAFWIYALNSFRKKGIIIIILKKNLQNTGNCTPFKGRTEKKKTAVCERDRWVIQEIVPPARKLWVFLGVPKIKSYCSLELGESCLFLQVSYYFLDSWKHLPLTF